MKIGIDIDGVLTDVEQWQYDVGSKYFSKFNKKIEDYKGFGFCEIYNIDKIMYENIWKEYRDEYLTLEPVRKYADEVIEKLKNEGNKIIIITARGAEYKSKSLERKIKRLTLEWLNKNNIYYDEIIFSEEDKLNICIKNNIDIMIEDKKENINKISTTIPIICFNSNYNTDCKKDNIFRVFSWYDIYMKIKNIQN